MSSFNYNINSERIIGETPNTAIKLCRIEWGENPEKIDVRRWNIKMNGENIEYIPNKGISLSEENAKELAFALVDEGICDDARIARVLENRHNIIIDIPDTESNNNGNYINPNDILN